MSGKTIVADQEERVLVVRRQDLFGAGRWRGLRTERLEPVAKVVRERSFFMPRSLVEDDPGFQQVIPYIVFRHRDRFLLTRRLGGSTEHRLRQLYSLGVGGHINPVDAGDGDPMLSCLWREWEEEVAYEGGASARLLGFLADDSAPVSRVHVGAVHLVVGDSPGIAIREVDKLSGQLLSLEGIRPFVEQMESWSRIVHSYLAEAGFTACC